MKYIYLVYMYKPKYKYNGFLNNGRYLTYPKVFKNYKDAVKFKKDYNQTAYIKKIKINEYYEEKSHRINKPTNE